MSQLDIPVLQPRFIYGLQTKIKGNVSFITDEDILYPVGGVLVLHNVNQYRQKFIKLPDKGLNVTRILVSPNKKVIAVVEKGERPSITLYCTQTLKKKRQLVIPPDKEVNSTEFTTVNFTFDSKFLIAVSGEPDWLMYSFKCDKGKLDSVTRANNSNGTGTVWQVACNPNDANLVILVGDVLFRILACSDSVWRQYGFSKADQLNLRCAVWLSQDRLIAGNNDGKIIVVESGELRAIFWAGDLPFVSFKLKDEIQQQSSQTNISIPSTGSLHSGEDYEIRTIITFPKGFAFAYLNGTIHFYEKETAHKFRKRNVFKIPDCNIERDYEEHPIAIMNEVNCLDINPNQDRLVITCAQSQIYTVRLWGTDITVSSEILFTELGCSLHHGGIGGLAVCSWKPIFLTSGEWDRTLRVWNYETFRLELTKQFQEDVYAVALHPSGLYAAVGFSDKLRFLTILIDDFHVTREFPIRNCKKCSFSNMGHLFAAAHGNIIQVFNSITFENVLTLKGHNGKIKDITWTGNDQKMASCGTEGAVYEWDLFTAKRTAETIIKTCSFTGSAVTTDGKSTYAVGSDGQVRELINSNIHRDVPLCPTGLDGIVLSNMDTMLFATGNSGTIFSVKLPILDFAEFNEAVVHNTTVIKMCITFDDKILITCSEDGVICLWKLLNIEGKAIKLDKDFEVSTNILIPREDLEEKITFIRDLQLRMHELDTEHAYQMRQTEVVNKLKVKELHEGYCSAIEELKEKNEQLESDHAQEISNINVEISNIRDTHDKFIQKMEANYNEKLIIEYDKYLRLEEKMGRMRLRYENELEELQRSKEESEKNITNDFLQQLADKDVQLEEMLEQLQKKTKEHELIKQQIEDDADREIYELKTNHEKELKEEQDANVRLKGETNIIRKKLLASQKEIDDLKHNVYSLENEHAKLKGVIIGLEKEIADLKKEILERDSTIQDKERRIYELKHKNQELEKFKFILDFKIQELNSQIEPKERTIREQTEQINDMVNELETLQKVITNLDLQLSELREKLYAADNELKREVLKNRAMKAALKSIRTEIHDASGYIQDIPKLTRVLKEMFHKYNADKDFELTQAEDVESRNEFLRQRDFLERTVKSLQMQVNKTSSTGGVDKIKLVEENSALLVETNALRKDLKIEQRNNKKMQSVLGLSSKYLLPRVAQKRLNDAVATREEIHNEYRNKIKEGETCLHALKDENTRLLTKITEEHTEEGHESSDE